VDARAGFTGCLVKQSACAVQGNTTSVTYRDDFDPRGQSNGDYFRCMQRSRELASYCQNGSTETITTSFVQGGNVRSTSYAPGRIAGCEVFLVSCLKHPEYTGRPFYDHAGVNGTPTTEQACPARARDYWLWCGLPVGVPTVTRYFTAIDATALVEKSRTVYDGR
jgi:hypothetical protein